MTGSETDDLAQRVEALEEDLRDLQAALQEEQPGGLPRPTEILRLTDQHAIPVAIAVLEAHIHALKFMQGLIRLSGAANEDHPERLGRSALRRLDSLVSDLRATPMPPESEARDLLEEARDLRAELEGRIDDADRRDESGTTSIDIDPVDGREEADATAIDIDDELDAIKSDVEEDEADDQSSGANR